MKGRFLCSRIPCVRFSAAPTLCNGPSSGRRRGISLLEVLMAILVLSVGLLGLAALFPVGRYEMAEALRNDRAATLGRAAFRDLQVRGYLRPQSWVGADGVPVLQGDLLKVQSGLLAPPEGPLVLDPLAVWPHGLASGSPSGGHLGAVKTFPYLLGQTQGGPEASAPKIARISLMEMASGSMMRYDLAARFFRSNDDLVFTSEPDVQRYPVQVYHEDGNLGLYPLYPSRHNTGRIYATHRQYSGDYSWFVVISPTATELLPPGNTLSGSGGAVRNALNARQYHAAVVVCYKRPLEDLSDSRAVLANPERGERMVWVDFTGGFTSGFNGGTALLRVENMPDPQTAARMLNVRVNQWLALTGQYETADPDFGMSYRRTVMQWYRIENVDAEVRGGNQGVYTRGVTLAGAKWSADGSTAWGTIVSGAYAVYEKTIVLEGSSLWAY